MTTQERDTEAGVVPVWKCRKCNRYPTVNMGGVCVRCLDVEEFGFARKYDFKVLVAEEAAT